MLFISNIDRINTINRFLFSKHIENLRERMDKWFNKNGILDPNPCTINDLIGGEMKRYTITGSHPDVCIKECPEGEWVAYQDVAPALKECPICEGYNAIHTVIVSQEMLEGLNIKAEKAEPKYGLAIRQIITVCDSCEAHIVALVRCAIVDRKKRVIINRIKEIR